jgi:NADH-quinone oxidoreductase subunit L
VLVAVGIGAGWALYVRRPRTDPFAPDPLGSAAPRLFAFLGAGMEFDRLYAATLGRLNAGLATLADLLDRRVWDGAVRLLAGLGAGVGFLNSAADRRGLNAGFDAISDRIRRTGRAYARAQTGETHGYLRALAIAFVLLSLLVLLGGPR